MTRFLSPSPQWCSLPLRTKFHQAKASCPWTDHPLSIIIISWTEPQGCTHCAMYSSKWHNTTSLYARHCIITCKKKKRTFSPGASAFLPNIPLACLGSNLAKTSPSGAVSTWVSTESRCGHQRCIACFVQEANVCENGPCILHLEPFNVRTLLRAFN